MSKAPKKTSTKTNPTEKALDANTKLVGILGLTLIAVLLLSGGGQKGTVEQHLAEARDAIIVDYNIDTARTAYERVLGLDATNDMALFNLARIYYITNDYGKALAAIEKYKDLYPEKKRIHYIAGLTNAYAGNLPQAQHEFELFLDSGLSSWPGYLDLAWVMFQRGNIEDARDTLEVAIGLFGEDNAWLNTSLGAAYVALGEGEKAEEVLLRAHDAYQVLTLDEWKENFSFNDPAQLESEMAQMGDVIAYNLALARGETVGATAELLSVPFADPSPKGWGSGLAVSACGESCPHTTCTPTNVCGESNVGEYVTCIDSCSVSAPADPSGTCEVVTPCGTLSGYNGCNGQCNLTSYCSSDGTEVTLEDENFDPSDISANLIVSPTFVQPGETVTVLWVSSEMASCSVTSNRNSDAWATVVGSQTSSQITEETTYSLTCTAFDDTVVTDSATVNLVPDFQEF